MSVELITKQRNVCLLDPIHDPRWSELVERTAAATIFHHPLWLRVISEAYRYPMVAVCTKDAGGDLASGLPIAFIRSRLTGPRLVSVPFSDTCGPIADVPGHEHELLSAVDRERRRRGLRLEVHADVPALPGGSASDRFYHHVIPLSSHFDQALRRVRQPKRRGAERAREAGVKVARRVDAGAMDAFFRLHVLTRRRLGIPTQPRRFFGHVSDLLAHGFGFLLIAEWKGRPIAANVYLRYRSALTYKYGASDPSHLEKRPNDLLHLEALRIACDEGCESLDLGRTELDNVGLQRFKRQLGAEQRELVYTSAPPSERKSVRSVSDFQHALVRRSPPAFGRIVGATLYRHFA